ncbi:MAG: sigma-54 dependent transcriptional regulator [Bacteroidia bacterium]|nr:sigma-54 dependent transcriptional regulator [Bacteroidia bacterium]
MFQMDILRIKQRFGIIGNSPLLDRAIDIAVQVAPTDLSVLISGESGVGKEVFPQIIHQHSARKHGTFIAVNCGAIPEGTIDSELFGHEKGSFTGAHESRKGYFEVADNGTIFLDEIGELPLPTQVRLLRVLESGEFIRVGSSKVLKTNVRMVAATNLNLIDAIREGKFREDLYYRLNTVPISLPPLRERKDDIFLLFRKFASDFAEKYRMPAIRLLPDAQHLLVEFPFYGNVRQLKNITEQISIIEHEREISGSVIRRYLPDADMARLPVIYKGIDEKTFASEREILYQILFDMKKDMNDLKKLVYEIMQSESFDSEISGKHAPVFQKHYQDDQLHQPTNIPPVELKAKENINIEDTEEVIEESLSLETKEKEIIIKALEKYKGKRKQAANELGISERTLYRKIKDYNIDY